MYSACMANDSYNLQAGDGGVVIVTGQTFAVAGDGRGARFVVFDNDTEVGGYEGNITNGSTAYVGKTFKAGQGLGGRTTALLVTTGMATLYGSGPAADYTIT